MSALYEPIPKVFAISHVPCSRMADHFDTVWSFNNWIFPEPIVHSHHSKRVKEIVRKLKQFCCVITFLGLTDKWWFRRDWFRRHWITLSLVVCLDCLETPDLGQQAHRWHQQKEHLDMEWQTWKDQSKIDPTYHQEYLLGEDRHQYQSHHQKSQQVYDEHMHEVLDKVAWFFQILRELKAVLSQFQLTNHDLKKLTQVIEIIFFHLIIGSPILSIVVESVNLSPFIFHFDICFEMGTDCITNIGTPAKPWPQSLGIWFRIDHDVFKWFL